MSMTKEEAFKQYEEWRNLGFGHSTMPSSEVLVMAMDALHPITREQVEKTKAVFCQPCVGDFEQDTWRCSKCFVQEFGDVRAINFCPHCGAPMTEEAVETIMKRMEEMRND